MEEVYLERFPKSENSVHLLDIPKPEKDWYDPYHVKDWDKIRNVRRVVTGAIEVLRQDKVIGSSWEASAVIFIKDKDLFDMEYWSLEQAKLSKKKRHLMSGKIVLISGAAGGIGRAIVERFEGVGAEVIAIDINNVRLYTVRFTSC